MKSQSLRVLLAEDSLAETGLDLRALCANQGRSLELVFVSDPSNLAHTLLQSQPHAAFLSLSLLQPDPVLAVSLLHKAVPHIPLILFVHPADTDCAVECLRAGAENYILKGFLDLPTLDHILHKAIRRNNASELPGPTKSQIDPLTKLPNRAGLLCQLRASSQQSVLSGPRLLLSVRLSNLQELQDSAGQFAVADTIHFIARQLRALVRSSDLLACVAPGVFALVVFDAGDSCRASLQRRMEASLLHPRNFKLSRIPPPAFSVEISSWNSTSPRSFPRALSHHLSPISPKKRPLQSPRALSSNPIPPPAPAGRP